MCYRWRAVVRAKGFAKVGPVTHMDASAGRKPVEVTEDALQDVEAQRR